MGLKHIGSIAAFWLITLSATDLLCAAETPSSALIPTLLVDTPLSSEGYFVLSWDSQQSVPSQVPDYILQLSQTPDFSDVTGFSVAAQGSMTLSGYPDGDYFVRLALPNNTENHSAIVEVSVRHHSLQRAFTWFGVGLFLFVVLCSVIFIGHRNTMRQLGGASN